MINPGLHKLGERSRRCAACKPGEAGNLAHRNFRTLTHMFHCGCHDAAESKQLVFNKLLIGNTSTFNTKSLSTQTVYCNFGVKSCPAHMVCEKLGHWWTLQCWWNSNTKNKQRLQPRVNHLWCCHKCKHWPSPARWQRDLPETRFLSNIICLSREQSSHLVLLLNNISVQPAVIELPGGWVTFTKDLVYVPVIRSIRVRARQV